jgi:hypothetical protein
MKSNHSSLRQQDLLEDLVGFKNAMKTSDPYAREREMDNTALGFGDGAQDQTVVMAMDRKQNENGKDYDGVELTGNDMNEEEEMNSTLIPKVSATLKKEQLSVSTSDIIQIIT